MVQLGQMVINTEGTDGSVGVPDGAANMSLIFRAGQLLCALRLNDVIETMRPLVVQPLAGTPPYVSGISIMRGLPTPVIDVARLLGGCEAQVTRFVAVRTGRGPIALATSTVMGIRPTLGDTDRQNTPLLGAAPARMVAAVGAIDTEPIFQLHSMRLVPDEVWAAAAAPADPS
jgi:purine-binding chemotaxis protein CheW